MPKRPVGGTAQHGLLASPTVGVGDEFDFDNRLDSGPVRVFKTLSFEAAEALLQRGGDLAGLPLTKMSRLSPLKMPRSFTQMRLALP
jgi:hypothetical protein